MAETVIEVTFVVEREEYTARLPRSRAIDWLRSHGFRGMSGPSGTTDLEALSDSDIARVLGSAALNEAIKSSSGMMNVSENEEEGSWVTFRTDRVIAVKAIPDFDVDPDAAGHNGTDRKPSGLFGELPDFSD